MLASSTLSAVVMAYPVPFDENFSEQNINNNLDQNDGLATLQENENKATQVIVISVFEKIGFSGNEKKFDDKATEEKTNDIQNRIQIEASEKIIFETNEFGEKLAIQKEISDRKAIMEKIWNSKRIRFTGNHYVMEDQIVNFQSSLLDEFYELTDQTIQELLIDFNPTRNLPVITASLFLQQANPMQVVLVDSSGSSISSAIGISRVIDQGVNSINDFTSVDNPTVLLLLVPIAGYIFVRAENVQLKFYNFRKVSSLILVFILLSSAVTLPLSISTSYGIGLL